MRRLMIELVAVLMLLLGITAGLATPRIDLMAGCVASGTLLLVVEIRYRIEK